MDARIGAGVNGRSLRFLVAPPACFKSIAYRHQRYQSGMARSPEDLIAIAAARRSAAVSLAAWKDPTFRRTRTANLVMDLTRALFRAGLLPRQLVDKVLVWSVAVSLEGVADLRRRRFRQAMRR